MSTLMLGLSQAVLLNSIIASHIKHDDFVIGILVTHEEFELTWFNHRKSPRQGLWKGRNPTTVSFQSLYLRGVRNVDCFQIPPYGSLLRLGRLGGLISDDNHDSGAL